MGVTFGCGQSAQIAGSAGQRLCEHPKEVFDENEELAGGAVLIVGLSTAHGVVRPGFDSGTQRCPGGEQRGPFAEFRGHRVQ